jgi:hypothetical protein
MAHGVLLFAALTFGQPDRATKEPTYKFELHKAEDSVVVRKEKDRTVFVVTCKSGIGGADIVLTGGEWPENVTFRLLYSKGNGFDTLEDIRMNTDRLVVQGSQNSSGKMPFCFAGPDVKLDVIEPGGREAAGVLDVRVRRGEEGLDVTLPANVLRGSGKLRVAWIDAYRR